MDAVHLASSRQVHLSFNGVIVDIGTHATRQFLCPPIEIRFAALVPLPNRFLTARLKPSPTENCITAACQVPYRIAENCALTNSLTKIHSIGVLGRSS